MVVPLGLKGYRAEVPTEPSSIVVGVRRGDLVPNRERVVRQMRWVDRSLVGERSGMVGDSSHTRGFYARAQDRDCRGVRGRGFDPFR